MRLASYTIRWRPPILLKNLSDVISILNKRDNPRVFIITGKKIFATGLHQNIERELIGAGITHFIYNNVTTDPTIEIIEDAVEQYKKHCCNCLIAFGGGSVIDCAKIIAAKIIRPNKSIRKMKGLLKIQKPIPLLIAIPTTAGSGSEATITAVVMDEEKKEKFSINDPVLVPRYALLNPCFLKSMPKNIIASTGMDALVHAFEAYLGKSNTRQTKIYAMNAIKLIFDNLEKAYSLNDDMAFNQMQMASYNAGLAFTRAYVGYVHAISHALGGLYGTNHGLSNAVILPHVLEIYDKKIYLKISRLHDFLYPQNSLRSRKEKFDLIVSNIKKLNNSLGIPSKLKEVSKDNIKILSQKAIKEANPLYPVPKILNRIDIEKIIYKIAST